jgi:hypothetical protein
MTQIINLAIKPRNTWSEASQRMSIAQSGLFDYGARSAELFILHFGRRHRLDYRRFKSALDAICFAIEELDEKLLHGAVLEVDETRYKSAEIKSLYNAIPMPWGRKPAASGPKSPKQDGA